jgi:hypothetical protein
MQAPLESWSTPLLPAVSLSSFAARSPFISGQSVGNYPLLADDMIDDDPLLLPNQGDGGPFLPIMEQYRYRSPARTTTISPPRVLRKRNHTSTVRAMMATTTTNRPHPQTMQRVAYLSTQPDSPPKEGTGSSSTSSSSSASFSTSTTPSSEKSYPERAREALVSFSKAVLSFFIQLPGVMWFYLTHPRELRTRLQELKEAAKKEAHHYWMGSKVCIANC